MPVVVPAAVRASVLLSLELQSFNSRDSRDDRLSRLAAAAGAPAASVMLFVREKKPAASRGTPGDASGGAVRLARLS